MNLTSKCFKGIYTCRIKEILDSSESMIQVGGSVSDHMNVNICSIRATH